MIVMGELLFILHEKDGWITRDFTSFSTVFQSYQDDGWMIMKVLCNGTPLKMYITVNRYIS